jgi:hypothetical protein
MEENRPPPSEPRPQTHQQPHRGVLILVLGILGLVCCFICGIIAWVMGSGDLKQMDAGIMDASGRGLTQAGKICGMIAVVLQIVGFVIWLLAVGLGLAAGARNGAPMPM